MLEIAFPFSANSPILFTPLGEISCFLTLLGRALSITYKQDVFNVR